MNAIYLGILTIFAYLITTALLSAHLFGQLSVKRPLFWTLAILCLCSHGWILVQSIETPAGFWETQPQPLMMTHILMSFGAICFLTLANGQAILMGLQHSLLKSHHPSHVLRLLPPLQTMEKWFFFILLSGLIFLGGSLLSGLFSPFDLFHTPYLPKTVLALTAFILLAVLLIGRLRFGWRGHTAVRLTLSGTGFALLSYFGTKALCL